MKPRHYLLWILLLAAALRFVQIDSPPVGRHAWRQCDTASVARNFLDNGHRLLYPQIDWEIPGYVEMEFPIYPWVTSLIYRFTGESMVVARLLAVLGSLLTIWFLFAIVRRILGERAALWAAFVYAVLPANLFFGRTIMPEAWMLAASAAAIYWFGRWVDDDSWLSYALAWLATTLACLLKLTNLYLGLPLVWLAWQRWRAGTFRQGRIWLYGLLVTLPLVLWYDHAYRLGQEFGASFHILTAAGSDKWGIWSLLIDPRFYERVFLGYLGGRMLTWVGLLLLVIGIFLPRRAPRERLFDVWGLAVVTVLLLASGGSLQHDYYSLPLLLPAAVFMAKVFDRGWESARPWLTAALVAILLLSGYRYLGTLGDEREPGPDLEIAEALAAATLPEERVISCDQSDPVWFYLSNRRGWGRDCEALGENEIDEMIRRGARVLVARPSVESPTPEWDHLTDYLRSLHEVLQDDELVFLVRLQGARRSADLDWQLDVREDFSDSTLDDRWTLQGDSWSLVDGSLVGTRVRRPIEAVGRLTPVACRYCRALVRVSVEGPRPEDRGRHRPSARRGGTRTDSHAVIELWSQADGTAITLSLNTRQRALRLSQAFKDEVVATRRVSHSIRMSQPLDLEVRVGPFEIELWIDGQPMLKTRRLLTDPLAGNVVFRPRLGSLRVDSLELQRSTGPAHAAAPALQP